MSEAATSRLISAVFQAWNRAGLEFLVLRNYEQLPARTENDIDVLVKPDRSREAEQILVATAADEGFQLHNRAEFATLAIYLFETVSGTQIHFDLFSALLWRGWEFLESDGILARKVKRGDFYIPHPAHEAACNLLASMIYTGQVKEKYKKSISSGFQEEPQTAKELLSQSYGLQHAVLLVEAGAAGQWDRIEGRTAALRRTLVLRQIVRSPLRTAKSFLAMGRRLFHRMVAPPGLVVALCGPDGSGKSTAAELLIAALKTTFSPQKGAYFHWKPRLFRRAHEGQPCPDPHGRPARNALGSWLFFGLHWLEFIFGGLIRIRPLTFRGGLVLIDRYYYDYFVDQARYRLRVPQWLVRFGYRFIKKPDLVIVLDASPDVLQQRKREVPFAETERQRHAYRQLLNSPVKAEMIDASQTPARVVSDIERLVLQCMALRIEARKSGKPLPASAASNRAQTIAGSRSGQLQPPRP